MVSAIFAAASPSRARIITLAPAPANALAAAAPMPRLPPVTIATFPVSGVIPTPFRSCFRHAVLFGGAAAKRLREARPVLGPAKQGNADVPAQTQRPVGVQADLSAVGIAGFGVIQRTATPAIGSVRPKAPHYEQPAQRLIAQGGRRIVYVRRRQRIGVVRFDPIPHQSAPQGTISASIDLDHARLRQPTTFRLAAFCC